MKITKICAAIFSFLLIFTACETEESLEITSPEAELRLLEPGVSNINLNFGFPDNPALTLVWNDQLTGGTGGYTIELSPDALFENPMVIGTSTTNRFTMTVNEFNSTVLDAGGNAFEPFTLFARVVSEGQASNSVSFSVSSYSEASPVVVNPTDGSSYVLSGDTADDVVLNLEWNDPDFGESSSVDVMYEVQFAEGGTDFATLITQSAENETSLSLTHAQLNTLALNAGIEAETTGSLDMRIMASIIMASGNMDRVSEPISINVTTYNAGATPASWGVVGSGYNNWGAFEDGTFYTTDQPDVYITYLTLVTGEIKFRQNSSWDSGDFGDNGADGTLDAGGQNIAVTAGTYKITMNLNDNTYSLEPFSLGIVGSGFNDWGGAGPDAKFYYDYTTNTFKRGVRLLEGEIKFRLNNDWGTNYGGSGGNLALGGDNIISTAGHYLVTVDLNNSTYSIIADDVLGIVGSGFNNWGESPDFSLTQIQPDVWVGDIVTLVDGEIKFRVNNEWNTDYGDNGADGTLEPGGANIAVTAGEYRVKIDLTTNEYALNQVQ